jgi:hypothetical protein
MPGAETIPMGYCALVHLIFIYVCYFGCCCSLAHWSCSANLLPESGMEHVRVHPRFLHSNATSHKWALGGMVCSPWHVLEMHSKHPAVHFSKFFWCMMVLLTCQLSPSCWTTLLMKYAWLKERTVLVSSFKSSCAHSVVFLCKVSNGATFVNIDMLENKKDGSRMLLVQGVKLSHFK